MTNYRRNVAHACVLNYVAGRRSCPWLIVAGCEPQRVGVAFGGVSHSGPSFADRPACFGRHQPCPHCFSHGPTLLSDSHLGTLCWRFPLRWWD